MIQRITRKKLDVEKYNACVTASLQSNVFALSWYLDSVCKQWDAFVLNDYEAVMPIPWRKKAFVKYVRMPFFTLELGVFSKEIEDENEFLIELFDDFKYVNLNVTLQNHFSMFHENKLEKVRQFISLNTDYSSISNKYKRNRKKELVKSTKEDYTEHWSYLPQEVLELFENHTKKRVKKLKKNKRVVLLKLMKEVCSKKRGEVLSIYDKNNKLISFGFFVKDNDRVVMLFSSIDLKKRQNASDTFLIDKAVYKYQPHFKSIIFGDVEKKAIKKYLLSFNTEEEKYFHIKQNKLPKFIKPMIK